MKKKNPVIKLDSPRKQAIIGRSIAQRFTFSPQKVNLFYSIFPSYVITVIIRTTFFYFQHYPFRAGSPGLILREYNKPRYEDISRIYTYSYLTEEPTLGYLKRPIEPYDKPPTSPHFHRPTCKYEAVLKVFVQYPRRFIRNINFWW